MRPEIEEFAEKLVSGVRDRAIQSSDQTLQADHLVARRWRAAAAESPESFARELIPDIVDDVLFFFLEAVDSNLISLKYSSVGGNTVDLNVDGLSELAGEYLGSDGWRAKYSRERFVDYGQGLSLDDNVNS